MTKANIRYIGRILLCGLLAMVMLAPIDADAKKKKKKKATTTATTRRRSSSSTKKSNQRTVTEATQEAAISASKRNTGKQSGLMKITVDKPDLEEIRVATLDPSSKYYFPKLMAKYRQNDTTMNLDEYRYLYLGYMFQEDYDPYRTSPYAEMTDDLREKEELTNAEMDTIINYVTMALDDNPFDLGQMSYLVSVLKKHRKPMRATIWEYRLENLLAAIKSTGTGQDADNAWYVIYPMHEYNMVQLLGYEAVDIDFSEPGIDHLIVVPDGTVNHRRPAEGFYFNVLVPQQQYELKHPAPEMASAATEQYVVEDDE